jgi:hypothetical protein
MDNLDNASFCRKCGTDMRVVSQALSGNLPMARADEAVDEYDRSGGRRRRKRKPTIESGIRNIFMGIGFVCVSLAVLFYAPAGEVWWFWMLIPAFTMLGGGVGELVRVKRLEKTTLPSLQNPAAMPTTMPPVFQTSELPPRNTGELMPPPSVTDRTTRLLRTEVGGGHDNSPAENQRHE